MKVRIKPVEKPASFADVKFSQKDWEAAVKQGTLKVPYVTAKEAMRNSKGLYQIEAEKKVAVEIKGLREPTEMTSAELVAEMTMHGKPPRKKMNRATAVKFVTELRERATQMIVEDDDAEVDAGTSPGDAD